MKEHEVQFGKLEEKAVYSLNIFGEDEDCAAIDIFEVDGVDYIALLGFDSQELYIFNFKEDNGNEVVFDVIEDEDFMDEIYDIFQEEYSDEDIEDIIDSYDYTNEDELEDFSDYSDEEKEDFE
ncbi:MAG: DUF1292 domain-containing protein [Peptoniphilaceae bacterium]|nr:DUF1292 domain-containing protein [Peptoniphilaceae bacterium]MDD7382953.1 DUF1292 domain-containing protein [Peptoniphilaceae bacterium]MDY3737704.1 DUF1292 domain-containing protein [Peptoniphilaceae bacterium]